MEKDIVVPSKQIVSGIKYDQLVNVVPKDWGHEEWIVNNAKYCGKKLVFNTGCRSLHYHKIKEETFYVVSGKVYVELIDGNQKINRVMEPGDTQHIVPGLWHRITALQPSEVMEFSTFHMDEDSYRIEASGTIDLRELGF
ncbi:cupin domain-containing protein [Candidatus Babeliales bacterium]|nr:cupin domain-containing protein [Candidatus Babeliales bacterium]